MKRITTLAAMLLVVQVGVGAECVRIGPDGKPVALEPPGPPPVILVSGAFCGTAFGAGGSTVLLFENAEFDLIDSYRQHVATVRTDESGRFTAPPLPVGRYHATQIGFMKTEEVIEITNISQAICERPLYVTLQVGGEIGCTPASHISTTRPKDR